MGGYIYIVLYVYITTNMYGGVVGRRKGAVLTKVWGVLDVYVAYWILQYMYIMDLD